MESKLYGNLPDDSIRVVDLQPGGALDLVQVKLRVVDFQATTKYDALSYTWGNANDTRLILCNEQELQVTVNLFDALVKLRHTHDVRTIWIDAICINQLSMPERTQQVKLMLKIYKLARTVYIWTGNATEDDDIELLFQVAKRRWEYGMMKEAIRLGPPFTGVRDNIVGRPLIIMSECRELLSKIKGVYQHMTESSDERSPFSSALDDTCAFVGMREFPTVKPRDSLAAPLIFIPKLQREYVEKAAAQDWTHFDEFLIEALKPPELDLSDYNLARVFYSLMRFCGRSYWRRAWIVQEVIVSTDARLLCGPHEIDLVVFSMIYSFQRGVGNDVKNFMLDDYRYLDDVENQRIRMKIWQEMPDRYVDTPKGYATMAHMSAHRTNPLIEQITLSYLLMTYGNQMATNPRDHIFSLVGVLKHFATNKPRLVKWCTDIIDYDLEPGTIFLETAKHIVESFELQRSADSVVRSQHILDLFQLHHGNRMAGLPSWVPDWSSRDDDHKIALNKSDCSDTIDLIPYTSYVRDKSLFITGHIFDQVGNNMTPLETPSNDGLYVEINLCEDLVVDQGLGQVYGDSEDIRFEAFWRTIIADDPFDDSSEFTPGTQTTVNVAEWITQARHNFNRIKDLWSSRLQYRPTVGPWLAIHRKVPATQSLINQISVAFAQISPIEMAENLPRIMKQPSDPEWNGLEARSELSEHSFIVTNKGYFGLAPSCVQPGDAVVMLAGTSSPWFLRKVENHYKVVAHGFIHGLMYKHDAYYKNGWQDGDIQIIELQ